ncbi:MAG: Gfo/Idh/MocA family oxidoreductase [Anaerolineae bacterium]|nr:Gfo/Idh/MocA family oxidoreductase [Anaerolineae bacterium]NUQ03063.1 Gfo/Idh/MocA family oxidoreductase [Anaerolineae bacterium]
MTNVPPLGIGIIGLHEGRTLLKAINLPIPAPVGQAEEVRYRAPHVRVVAACDLNLQKLDEVRADDPAVFTTPDYAEMLRRDDVQIVAIYTPDAFHADHILQAFAAGKHVICTKPLVNNMADARRLWAASRGTDRRLLVGQSVRFFESFRRQRAAFEAGEVGALELADAHYIHRMDWYYRKSPWAANATDWIFLGMSHPLDLLCWYLGPVAEVTAYGAHSALASAFQVRSPDICTVNLRTVDGRLGRALGHYGLHELPSARNALELMLYGTGGTSLAQYHDMRYLYTRPDGTEAREDTLYALRGYAFNNEAHGMHYGEFASYAETFALALLEGRSCAPTLEDGLAVFAVMEAARQSIATGQAVAVPPILEEIQAG